MHLVLRSLALAPAWFACALAAAASSAAQDPLDSPGCHRALDALQVEEAAQEARAAAHAAGGGAADSGLLAARREAARACLATRPDAPAAAPGEAPAGRLAQPPVRVRPVVGMPGAPLAAARAPAAPITPATPTTRPQFVTSCDAGGCWANDGTRLERYGPALSAGSRGLCTLQGTLLTCP